MVIVSGTCIASKFDVTLISDRDPNDNYDTQLMWYRLAIRYMTTPMIGKTSIHPLRD